MVMVLLVSETAFAETARPAATATADAEIEFMLSHGNYTEGEVLVLLKGDSSEEISFLGSSGRADDLLSSAENIMDVSMDAALMAIGETSSDTQFLGSAPASSAQIVSIKSDTLSTRELMYKLSGDSRVMAVQPNYVHKIQDVAVETADIMEIADVAEISDVTEVVDVTEAGDATAEADADISQTMYAATLGGSGSSYPDLTGYQWGFRNDDFFNTLVNDNSPLCGFDMGIEGWNDKTKENATGYVVVVDTGVDYDNPDLVNVMANLTEEQLDGTNGGPHGYSPFADRTGSADPGDPKDVNGHGTHCAGIIAAEWNDFGTSGICNGVQIIGVAAASPQNASLADIDLLMGYSFISTIMNQGVTVVAVNNSWGAEGTCSPVFWTAVNQVGAQGAISIFATGNAGQNKDISPVSTWGLYNSPYVVTVGSANKGGTKSYFSNYGQDTCDVYGPGSEIMSTVPDLSGNYTAVADPDYIYRDVFADSDNTLGVHQGSKADILKLADKELLKEAVRDAGATSEDNASWGRDENIFSTVDPNTSSLKITLNDDLIGRGCVNLFIPVLKSRLDDIKNVSFCIYSDGDESSYVNPVLYWENADDDTDNQLYTGLTRGDINSPYGVGTEWSQITIPVNTQKPRLNAENIKFRLFTISQSPEYAYLPVALTIEATSPASLYIDAVGLGSVDTYWTLMDGTSMAAPAVTGAAAIVAGKQEHDGACLTGSLSAIHRANYLKSHILKMGDEKTSRQGGLVNLKISDDNLTPVINEALTDTDSDVITLKGAYFGNSAGTVTVGDVSCQVTSWTDEEITAVIPSTVMSGDLRVRVTAANGNGSTVKTRYQSQNGKSAFPSVIPSPSILDNDKHYATGLFISDPHVGLINGAALATEDSLYAILPDPTVFSSRELLCYDIYENSWRKVYDLNMATILYSSMTEMDGVIYIYLTGVNSDDELKNYFLAYDPAANQIEEIDITDIGNNYFDAGIINAGGTLLLIGGCDENGRPYNEDNVVELTITEGKAYLDIKGDFYVVKKANMYGLKSQKLAYFDGCVYAAGGVYVPDNSCILNPYMSKLAPDGNGNWICEDVSGLLPAGLLTDSSYYQPTYGLTATDDGLFIVGATVTDSNGEVDANDTYVLTAGASSFEPWDKIFCLGQTAFTVASAHDGIIYAIAESRIASGENGNIYAAASEKKERYAVTFDTDGGSFVSGEFEGLSVATKYLFSVTTVEQPDDPEKEDCVFLRWIYEGIDGEYHEYDFENTLVDCNITLLAEWEDSGEVDVNTVTFDTQGGSFVSGIYSGKTVATEDVEPGDTAERPVDPVKDRYTFIAWMYKNDEGELKEFDFNTPIISDITLYAEWKANVKPVPSDDDEESVPGAIQASAPVAGASSITVKWSIDNHGQWSAKYTGQELKDTFAHITYNGKTCWYHFNRNGDMDTGWLFVNGTWYYLSTEHNGFYGSMLTGWFNNSPDGFTYYFDRNGRMLTGWQYIDGGWYYFNTNTLASYSIIDGKWTYTNTAIRPYGAMYRNEMTPDGYFVDENGKWRG